MPTEVGGAHGTITIDAELEAARAQLRAFASEATRALDHLSESTQRSENAFKSASNAATQFGNALGVTLSIAGAVQLGRMALELGKGAAQADAARASFDTLAKSVGESADEMLAGMQKAAHGAVSNADLIVAANRAIISQVIHSSAEMNQLLEIARATGASFGFSTTESFERIIGGLAKLEPELLDELGITVKLNDAYATYAASLGKTSQQLTEAERRQALYNEVVRQTEPAVKAAGEEGNKSLDTWNTLGASFDNLKQSAGDLFNAFGFIDSWAHDFDRASDELQTLVGWFKQLKEWADRVKATDIGEMLRQAAAGGGAAPTNPFAGGGGFGGGGGGGGSGGFGGEVVGPTQDELAARSEWADKAVEIEINAGQARLEEQNRYETAITRSEAEYQDSVAQSAADFAKRRIRAQEDYENSIVDIMRAAQQRDARMAEDNARQMERMASDHSKRLGDLQEELDRSNGQRRADSAERLADLTEKHDEDLTDKRADSARKLLDIEKDYERQRVLALRGHQDNLSDAAARLDANAVFLEQRRFGREQEAAGQAHEEKVSDEQEKLQESIANLNEAYNQKLADEQESLQKSIDQANAAYQRQVGDENESFQQRTLDANAAHTQQLADAKAADAQRITDMAAHFEEQKRRENDDQIERMGRMATHHSEEMTQFNTEHGQRLTQIGTHAQDERDQLDIEFKTQLDKLHVHYAGQESEQDAHQKRVDLMYQLFLDRQEKAFINAQIRQFNTQLAQQGLSPFEVQEFNANIYNLNNALEPLNTEITNLGNELAALGTTGTAGTSGISGTADISSIAGLVGGTGQVTPSIIAPGGAITINAPITINGVSGQTATDLADIIDGRLLEVFTQAAGYGSGR